MPSALIHNATTDTQIIRPLVPSINLTGLDTAEMEIDYNGTVAALLNEYKPDGSKTAPNNPNMYCIGVGGISEAAFGWIQCTIRYKGFWDGLPATVEGFESGTKEQLYPFSVGSYNYYYGKPPGKNTDINPDTGRWWRVNDINDTAFITRRGVEIGTAGTIPAPPNAPNGGKPSWMDTGVPRSLPDPLISTRSGWVRRSYKVISEETIGSKVFRFWEDTHEWVPQQTL